MISAIRVLIVDDMRTMRKVVQKACLDMGITDVIEAEDGEKAYAALVGSEVPVGLIISDWNMPVCNGLDFLRKVRAHADYKSVPFIMLTAENEAKQVKDAAISGASGYLIKPFRPLDFRNKITDALTRHALKEGQ